ncbi:hypothetical protein GCM10018790_63730 [Kitasatospora xanthocidica]|nr:hypothetical protein GCM10018790_63730 [Kitasatospora xanthocidica]
MEGAGRRLGDRDGPWGLAKGDSDAAPRVGLVEQVLGVVLQLDVVAVEVGDFVQAQSGVDNELREGCLCSGASQGK